MSSPHDRRLKALFDNDPRLKALFDTSSREGPFFTFRKWLCLCGKWVPLHYDNVRRHLKYSSCTAGVGRDGDTAPLFGMTSIVDELKARAESKNLEDFIPRDAALRSTLPGQHCTGCDEIFHNRAKADAHRKGDGKKHACTQGELRDVMTVRLIDEAYHPLPERPSGAGESSFRPGKERLPAAARVDQDTAHATMEDMVHESDDPRVMTKVFRMVLHLPDCKTTLASEALAIEKACKNPGAELDRLMKCAEHHFTNFAPCVHIVGGGVRTAIQVYKWEGHSQSDDGDVQAFTERQTTSASIHCIKRLLAYLYVCHYQLLRPYLEWMRGPDYSVEEAHATGLIGSLLCDLIKEETPTGTPTVLVKFSLLYLCRATGPHDLSVVESGRGAQLLSCLQYVLRSGVLQKFVLVTSLPGTTWSNGMELVRGAQESIIMNQLGPSIAMLRGMSNSKPANRRITVDGCGNITIDHVTILDSLLSRYIPNILREFHAICASVFQDDNWKEVACISNVLKFTNWAKMEGHIVLERGGGTLDLGALRLSGDAHEHIRQFIALGMLSCLSLGAGAGRFTEVDALRVHQGVWRHADFFFTLVSKKVGALLVRRGKPRLLMLPRDISRCIVLLRVACKKLGMESIEKNLFPDLPDSSAAICESFKAIMNLGPDVHIGVLLIRHCFTTVLNLVFPNTPEQFGTVQTDREVAEKSGHTEKTANAHYSCCADQRLTKFANEFHRSLGYDEPHMGSSHAPTAPSHTDPIMDDPKTVVTAAYGPEASFLNEHQEKAVRAALTHTDSHLAIISPPGGGKTLAAAAGSIMCHSRGQEPPTVLFVVPHAPLVGYQVQSIAGIMRRVQPGHPQDEGAAPQDHFWVAGYSGSDIGKGRIPPEWTYFEEMPHFAVMTFDALANLIEFHSPLVAKMCEAGALGGVVFDELQTLGSELAIRLPKFELLRHVSSWGVRVLLLSGSVTPAIVEDLAVWLRLHDPSDNRGTPFPVIQGGDPIGAKFNFEVAEVLCPSFLEGCARMIANRAADTSVHVVCALKEHAYELHKEIEAYFQARSSADLAARPVIAVTTGDDSTTEKTKSGGDWVSGVVDIWITTSVGLEGNENGQCRQVYMVGLPGCMSDWLQIAGRLRIAQGGPDSYVSQLLPQGCEDLNNHARRSKRDDDLLNSLYSEQHLLHRTPKPEAASIFGGAQVVDLYRTDKCLLETAKATFHRGHTGPDCRRCTNCDRKYGVQVAKCLGHNYEGGWCKPFVYVSPSARASSSPAGHAGPNEQRGGPARAPPSGVVAALPKMVALPSSSPGTLSPLDTEESGSPVEGSISGAKRTHDECPDGIDIQWGGGSTSGSMEVTTCVEIEHAPTNGPVASAPFLASPTPTTSASRKKSKTLKAPLPLQVTPMASIESSTSAASRSSAHVTRDQAGIADERIDASSHSPPAVENLVNLQQAAPAANQVSVSSEDYGGDVLMAMAASAQPAEPNARYRANQFDAADTFRIDRLLEEDELRSHSLGILRDEAWITEAERVAAEQAFASNLAPFIDHYPQIRGQASPQRAADVPSKAHGEPDHLDEARKISAPHAQCPLRHIQAKSQRILEEERSLKDSARDLFGVLKVKCPWCFAPACVGTCTAHSMCSLCGDTKVFHDAAKCPMTILYRCPCNTYSHRNYGDFHYHLAQCQPRGSKPHWYMKDNMGKRVQEILRQAGVCFLCYSPECERFPCQNRGSKVGTRMLALLRKSAMDNRMTLLELVSRVYKSPSSVNTFFGSMPRDPSTKKLAAKLPLK